MLQMIFSKENVKTTLVEILGSFLIAVGIYNFAVNAGFPMTGFSGIAIILNRLFGLPIGIGTILLNIPVAVLCYRLLGKRFFLRSIWCMLLSSVMIDYMAPYLPTYNGSRLLAAICTGVIAGYGYALIYMQNSSTGGADFITMAVKVLRPHLPLGKIIFIFDMVIILLGSFIFQDVDGLIYGGIVSYLFAVVVDKAMNGVNSGKLILTVTSDGKRIAEVIERTCQRGSTLLKAQGGYQQLDKDVVMCACNNKQVYQVQVAVKKADPESFVIVLESNEVHGEGFKMFRIGEQEA